MICNRAVGALALISASVVIVAPRHRPDHPRNKPKTQLTAGQGFTIPAGQFGFILTEERVTVPKEAIAFISIRARYKFRGLVNVSGFHVDPAYEGRLIFAVFNAGPGPVHLSQGEECFLIWYADLDQPSDLKIKKGFASELTGPIAGGLQSFAGLLSKINENDRKITSTAVQPNATDAAPPRRWACRRPRRTVDES
jgi:dCTP deaminase